MEGIEWFTLVGYYNSDVEITVARSNQTGAIEYTPEVCQTCLAQHKIDELMFENKKIFVRTIEEETAGILEDDQTPAQTLTSDAYKRPIQSLDDSVEEEDPPVGV